MRLPEELRKRVERRLAKQGFRDYMGLAQWLQRQGHEISASSLRRYGMSLARDLGATRRIARRRAGTEASMISSATTTEGLMQLAQEKLCSALAEVDQLKQGDMSRIAHAVAHLTQAAISLRRWTVEVHQRTEEHERIDSDTESAVRGGLSPETAQALRNALLGLSPFNREAIGSHGAATGGSEANTPAAMPVADEFEKSEKISRTVPGASPKRQDKFDGGSSKC
jgi:Protein of unknown function (DUF3486)